MTNYWDNRFISKIEGEINNIFEVGARYGTETLKLSEKFPNAKIFSFECNPNTIDICKEKLKDKPNIQFIPFGLGKENTKLPFYSYSGNDGASSFLKRIDFDKTQKMTGEIEIQKMSDFLKENNIKSIDLLCMDVQGFELNILKGADEFLSKIKYIIMEEPKPVINTKYLPKNTYSKYIDNPTPDEISNFMKENNFKEIQRIDENNIEDNVMYINTNFKI